MRRAHGTETSCTSCTQHKAGMGVCVGAASFLSEGASSHRASLAASGFLDCATGHAVPLSVVPSPDSRTPLCCILLAGVGCAYWCGVWGVCLKRLGLRRAHAVTGGETPGILHEILYLFKQNKKKVNTRKTKNLHLGLVSLFRKFLNVI